MFDPSKLKKIVLILLGMVFIIGSVAIFYHQRNLFGSDKLYFEISAPESVEAGGEVEYIVRYRNNSDVRLEDMILIFEYPDGSIPKDEEKGEEDENYIIRGDYRRQVEVGELNPGEEKVTTFQAILLEKKGASFEANAEIRYVPRNLAARYSLKREHITTISNVPISFEFQVPSNVDPDRESTFRLRFSSEIDYPLTDLQVHLTYPTNFHFIRSTPRADRDGNNYWEWPVLNKGDDGTIDIDGVLKGSPGDAKIFNASLRVDLGDRVVTLKEASRGTAISRSNLLIDMQVNGTDDYVAQAGELLHYEVFFRNVGEETLEELFLLVNLDGDTLDLNQVEPKDGRFQESGGNIIWSHTFDYNLLSLRENEEGRVEFWVRVRNDLPYNPEIKMQASMERASKILETKINTRLTLNQSVIREGAPFEVAGPFPFEEGEKSNYAVRVRARNYFTGVRNAIIKTKLPEGARITGEKSPEDYSLSFNSSTREVTIEIDSILAGEEKEIFFEVEVDPKKDFNEEDILVYETNISGEDRRTDREITATAGAVFLDQVIDISN